VDETIYLKTKSLLAIDFWRTLLGIRRRRYDAVILDVNHKAFLYQLIALLTGSKRRIGFNWEGRGSFCHTFQAFDADCSCVVQNMRLMSLVGAPWSDDFKLEYWIEDGDRRSVGILLENDGVKEEGRPVVCIHPGSHWPSNWWFPERYAEVINALYRRHAARIFITGTKDEIPLVESILRAVDCPCISLAGKTDLPQLASLLNGADLLVSVDTGPRHLAEAMGTPLVLLRSAQNHRKQWEPAADNAVVLRHETPCSLCFLPICPLPGHDCMSQITVEEVLEAAGRVLGSGSRHEKVNRLSEVSR
jgi:ADP-heptose:LPS heptosyltransferase